MHLQQIGTIRIPVGRCCDHCGGEYPDIAIKTATGICVYHSECVRHVTPPEDEPQQPRLFAEQLRLFVRRDDATIHKTARQ